MIMSMIAAAAAAREESRAQMTPANEPSIAIICPRRMRARYAALFPDAHVFELGEPRVGARYDRLLVFVEPKGPLGREYLQEFSHCLRRGASLEMMV